jgi:hypothetical protein
MSELKPLAKVYDEMRQAFGFGKDDNDGWVIIAPGGEIPLTIKGKQVVTPTQAILKESDWDKYQPFHPLCENIRRKKSPVLEKVQAYVTNRIKTVMVEIISKLTELSLDVDAHDKLTADQREYLTIFEKANDKTMKNFAGLFSKILGSSPGEAELVAAFVRRGGTWHGEEYARLTTISFPIMQEEFGETGKVFGHSITARDKDILFKVLRHILPKIDDPEAYCYGTRSEIAPMFHSLMMAFHSVAVDLNRVTKLLGGYDKEFMGRNLIVTSWSAQMPNLFEYKDVIPVLTGNDGEPNQEDVDKERRNQEQRDSRKQRDDRAAGRRTASTTSDRSGGNPFIRGRRNRDDEDDRRGRDRDRGGRRDRDDRGRDRGSNPFLDGGRSARGRDRDDDYDDDYDDRRDRRRGRDRYDDEDDRDDRRSSRRYSRDRDDRDENGVTLPGSRGSRRGRDYDDDYDDDYYDDRRSRRGRR